MLGVLHFHVVHVCDSTQLNWESQVTRENAGHCGASVS